MPGYEPERFVGTVHLDDYMCGICHGVLHKPVVSVCCGQSYCEDCIHEWLKQSHSCPTDRKLLRPRDLIQAPKNLLNLMNKLKIKCDFWERGCQKVVDLGNLRGHIVQCLFNPIFFCDTCGQHNYIDNMSHNCVDNLKDSIEEVTQEVARLRAENSLLKDKIRSDSDATDRTVTVLKSEMKKSIEQKAIDISKEAMDKCAGDRVEMARYIAAELDRQFGIGWNCFVIHGSNWGSLVKAYRNNYLQFKLGINEIVIFETKGESFVKIILIFLFVYMITSWITK